MISTVWVLTVVLAVGGGREMREIEMFKTKKACEVQLRFSGKNFESYCIEATHVVVE